MAPEGEQEGDFGASILPDAVEEAAIPLPLTDLQPWHRPRKQFIREFQWKHCAELLVQNLIRNDAPTIRSGELNYLTLPGIDYFDVEVIADLAVESGLQLNAMGLLADVVKEPIRARSQMREEALIDRGLILDTSVTYPYRFEELSSKKSQAYRDAKRRAPFHIINVDVCGSIALQPAQQSARVIDALLRIVELQLNTMRDPWLLYLTTDVRIETLSQDVRNALDDAIRQNAADSAEFRTGVVDSIGVTGDDLEEALARAEASPESFVTKFSLGFSKWLTHNAQDHQWNVKCRPFFCYSTRPHDDDSVSMPCLAFEFRPIQVNIQDVHGAVTLPQQAEQHGRQYSMEALSKAAGMVNVDSLLAHDGQLRIELAERQRTMLQTAGYRAEALTAFEHEYLDQPAGN